MPHGHSVSLRVLHILTGSEDSLQRVNEDRGKINGRTNFPAMPKQEGLDFYLVHGLKDMKRELSTQRFHLHAPLILSLTNSSRCLSIMFKINSTLFH